MTRVLVFNGADETSKRTYAALRLALRFGRNLIQQAPGRDVIRKERDLFRALDPIGESDGPDPKILTLKADGGMVVLDQALIEILNERIDKGPWTGDVSIDMADALDFLSAAPEQKD